MYYSAFHPLDLVNGRGVRCTLFVSGCHHCCKGCFNQKTWRPDFGNEYTPEVEEYILESLGAPMVAGLSLLGGDPFFPANVEPVTKLMARAKERYPEKDIWVWTGYTLEEMLAKPELKATLEYIDVLVEGKFVEAKKDLTLPHRGSSNQRILLKGTDF